MNSAAGFPSPSQFCYHFPSLIHALNPGGSQVGFVKKRRNTDPYIDRVRRLLVVIWHRNLTPLTHPHPTNP
jgi:hypothetical protein